MAKTSGLGDNLYISGYDLSGDIQQLNSISTPRQTLDVTGIDKSAHERIYSLRDGSIEMTTFFNPDSNQEHAVLKALPTTDVHVAYFRGTALGGPAAAMVAKQTNYDPTRANDGGLTFSVSAQANSFGLDWGVGLTAGVRTDSAATNGSSVDQTVVSTAFGWVAYLQVFAFTGTSVTVSIEDSADNSAFTTLSGASFTPATGVTVQRLASGTSTDTVRRYVRAVTTGTFSNAQFAVVFVRNNAATVV